MDEGRSGRIAGELEAQLMMHLLGLDTLSTVKMREIGCQLERCGPVLPRPQAAASTPKPVACRLRQLLAALVPRPRTHALTYHGLLAPATSHRDRAVPEQPEDSEPRQHRPRVRSLLPQNAGTTGRTSRLVHTQFPLSLALPGETSGTATSSPRPSSWRGESTRTQPGPSDPAHRHPTRIPAVE